jgi:glycosyltransferase involved in cell wall biosynthesis
MVTVVLPYFERQQELDRTLAALANQTYPGGLIEVIVADDGSNIPPDVTSFADQLNIEVLHQEHRGYGAGRARNLGAKNAHGEILVFLDSDMIPERQHIEAHARWHDQVSDAVVIGFRRHADFSWVSPQQLAEAVKHETIPAILDGQRVAKPEWIERHMARTAMLTILRDDFFLVMNSGNISMRKDTFWDAGGFDESFERWGGEDNELGFRLVELGAIVIPDRLAACWHQGEGQEPDQEELRSLNLQRPKMQNLIAELGYRKPQAGRSYTVPYAAVRVTNTDVSSDVVARTVDSILGSDFYDLIVTVTAPADAFATEWLEDRYRSDHRVLVSRENVDYQQQLRFSPLRVDVPAGTLFHQVTLREIVSRVKSTGVGLLYSTIPGVETSVAMLVGKSTRAINRARRLTTTTEDLDPVIGSLYGERWISGSALGLGVVLPTGEVREPSVPEVDASTRHATTSKRVATLESRVAKLKATNKTLRNRRALRIANAAGLFKSVRTREDAATAVRALWTATTR